MLLKGMSMKYTIIALMGKSGSGKTTLQDALLEEPEFKDANPIINCTTRPIRDNEQNGVNYHFLTNEEFTKDIVIISESNNMKVERLNKKELIIGYSESKIIDILQDIITQRFEDYGARIAKLTFDTEYEWFDIHSTATPAITFNIKIINPLLYN